MKKWEVINQQTLLANQRLIYRWRKIFKCSVLLLGLGTSTCKPETQGGTRNFLLPEPDPNPRNFLLELNLNPTFAMCPNPSLVVTYAANCCCFGQQHKRNHTTHKAKLDLEVLGRSRFFDCFFSWLPKFFLCM